MHTKNPKDSDKKFLQIINEFKYQDAKPVYRISLLFPYNSSNLLEKGIKEAFPFTIAMGK